MSTNRLHDLSVRSLTGRDIFTVTVSCGDIGNISEVVGWITEGGAEKWNGNDKNILNTSSQVAVYSSLSNGDIQ